MRWYHTVASMLAAICSTSNAQVCLQQSNSERVGSRCSSQVDVPKRNIQLTAALAERHSVLLEDISNAFRIIVAGGRSNHDLIYVMAALGAEGHNPQSLGFVSIEYGKGVTYAHEPRIAEILRLELKTVCPSRCIGQNYSYPLIYVGLVSGTRIGQRQLIFESDEIERDKQLREWKHFAKYVPEEAH